MITSNSWQPELPKDPTHRSARWTVEDYRPDGRRRSPDNFRAHIASAAVALVLIVVPIVFHQLFSAARGAISAMVLMGLLIGISTLLLFLKDFPPDPDKRGRPEFPPGVSREEQSEIVELGAAYGQFRSALESVPNGPARNRIVSALAGTEPGDVALDIVTSIAWSDSWLADQKLEVDPVREAYEIYDYLGRVAAKVGEFSDRADALQNTPAAASYREYADDLTADLSAVQNRARALFGYRTDIDRLSGLLQAEQAQPQLESDADTVLDLVAESRRHELAAKYLQQRQQELRMITDGLRELQSILNDTSTRLPSRPRDKSRR